ncbi:MAG TPA: DUF5640 domain-containing protein [Blastocatellia bacterium]|nr:DUF5640 domain-containing protein [Blastocatellia bacterium]
MTYRCDFVNKLIGCLILSFILATAVSAQEFKKGTYSSTAAGSKWSLKFDESGKVTVTSNGEVVVEGAYKVKGDELEVTDEKGPMACDKAQTGKYKWKLDGKKLTLTKVSDQCDGRATGLTAQPWVQE